MKEFVQVRPHNSQEFHAFEQRIALILRLLEHPPLKTEQAQFAVGVEGSVLQIGDRAASGAGGVPGGTSATDFFGIPSRLPRKGRLFIPRGKRRGGYWLPGAPEQLLPLSAGYCRKNGD